MPIKHGFFTYSIFWGEFCNARYCIILFFTISGIYEFFSTSVPSPKRGYTIPPIPGIISLFSFISSSTANVINLNLDEISFGKSILKLCAASLYITGAIMYMFLGVISEIKRNNCVLTTQDELIIDFMIIRFLHSDFKSSLYVRTMDVTSIPFDNLSLIPQNTANGSIVSPRPCKKPSASQSASSDAHANSVVSLYLFGSRFLIIIPNSFPIE